MKSFSCRLSASIFYALLLCFCWTSRATSAPGVSEGSHTIKSDNDKTVKNSDFQPTSLKTTREFNSFKPVSMSNETTLTAEKDSSMNNTSSSATNHATGATYTVPAPSVQLTTERPADIVKHLLNANSVSSVNQKNATVGNPHASVEGGHPNSAITGSTTGTDGTTIESKSKHHNDPVLAKDNGTSSTGAPQGMDAVVSVEQPQPQAKKSGVFPEVLISWVNDTYLVSIIVPVVAGVGCAAVIIFSIAIVACCRRHCCRRRVFRRRNLPEYIKQMTPADRVKLLAGSSDDEF